MGKRFRELTQTATDADFVEGNYFGVDTPSVTKKVPANLVAKASEQAALTTYAQNVARSIAPEFDPERTNENPYKAGESVTYTDGKTYVFNVDHYGAWAAADVDETDVQAIYASSIDMFGRFIPMSKSKNIFSKDLCRVIYPYYLANNLVNAGAGGYVMVYRVTAGTYTLSLPTGSYSKFNVGYIEEYPHKSSSCIVVSGSAVTQDLRDYKTVSVADGAKYLLVYFNQDGSGYDNDTLLGSLMIQKGEAKSAFEAFSFDGFRTNDYDIQKIDSDVKNQKTRTDALESYDDEIDKIQGKGLFPGILNGLTVVSMTDISLGIDFSEIDNFIYNTTSGNTYALNGFGISEAIAVDHEKSYVAKIRNNSTQNVYVMYFSDVAGTETLYGTAGKPSLPSMSMYVINPPAEAKSFRLCGVEGQVSLYAAVFGRDTDAANVESLLNAYFKNASIVIDESVISQVTLNSSNRLDRYSGLSVSSSAGVVSDPIVADFDNVYVLDTVYDQYRAPVAFYKDAEGYVLDSFQFPNVSAETTINHRLIVIPPTSKSFRICSRTSNINLYKAHFEMSSSDTELTERVSELEDSVAALEESAFLETTIDTVNAIKYKPMSTIYLGADIFDFSELSYDSDVWSVDAVNGTISYLGGSLDPITLQVSTELGSAYALECTQSNYTTQTNTVAFGIGDISKIDAYNGTNTLFVGSLSDGGFAKIYPMSATNAFTLSNLTLRKKVAQSAAVVTKNFEARNVNSGNSDLTLLDGKWNVAIGPTPHCQSAAVSLTRSIAIGYAAQAILQSGWQNIAIGTFALDYAKHGDRNIAIGCDCLYRITHPMDCIAIGKGSLQGRPGSVNWNDPATWQHVSKIVAIGTGAALIEDGQTVQRSVYIGYGCGYTGVGSDSTCIGDGIKAPHDNVLVLGFAAESDKNNQAVLGNKNMTETKIFGDLIVEGSDHVKRRIVFNNDNTCSWEVVS